MSGADLATAILLGIGVITVVASAIGVLLGRDFYERLQYMSPASSLGIGAIAAAVVVKESVNQAGIKAMIIAVVVFFTNSLLAHVTARAGRVRQYGKLDLRPEERARRRDAA